MLNVPEPWRSEMADKLVDGFNGVTYFINAENCMWGVYVDTYELSRKV